MNQQNLIWSTLDMQDYIDSTTASGHLPYPYSPDLASSVHIEALAVAGSSVMMELRKQC